MFIEIGIAAYKATKILNEDSGSMNFIWDLVINVALPIILFGIVIKMTTGKDIFQFIKDKFKRKSFDELYSIGGNIDSRGNITVRVEPKSFHDFTTRKYTYTLTTQHMNTIIKRKGIQAPTGSFWRVFLGLEGLPKPTKSDINKKYKELALKYHPDNPSGSHELMLLLNRAKDEAMREVK